MDDGFLNRLKHRLRGVELHSFALRAISLGVHDMEALAQLIPDPEVQEELLRAAGVNPLQGREANSDDLIREMEARTVEGACPLDDVRCEE